MDFAKFLTPLYRTPSGDCFCLVYGKIFTNPIFNKLIDTLHLSLILRKGSEFYLINIELIISVISRVSEFVIC